MTNLTEEISFITNTSSNKTYLVSNIKNLELIDFQIEMINRNVEGAFLSIESRQFNLEIQLYYETTSLISLDSYFKSNRISRKNFLDILKNLCQALVKAEEQYLSVNNYVLDLNKIYIEKESLQVKFIYIPIEQDYNQNVNEKFKDMVKDIIVDYANIDDTYSDHYLQKILNFLKNEKITIKEFYDFFLSNVFKDMGTVIKNQNNIQGIMGENRSFNSQSNNIQIRNNPTQMNDNFMPINNNLAQNNNNLAQMNNNPIQNNNNLMQTNNNLMQNNNNSIQGSNKLNKVKTGLSEETEVKEVYKTANIIISVATIIITVILAVLAFVLLDGFDVVEKFGVVLILAVIDYFVLRTLLDKKKKIKVKVKKRIDIPRKNINSENSNSLSNNNLNNLNSLNLNNSVPNNDINRINNFNINNGGANPNNVNMDNINVQNNVNMDNVNIQNNNVNMQMQTNDNSKYNMQNSNFVTNSNESSNNMSRAEMSDPQEIEAAREELEEVNEDETMLLSMNEAYLLSTDFGETRKVYVDNDRFRLGRLSAQVDYAISNKAVGKIHAEIINQDGIYYIVDLDSKNGTFVNRKRTENNVPYPLNDDDEIMIANVKYIFKLY